MAMLPAAHGASGGTTVMLAAMTARHRRQLTVRWGWLVCEAVIVLAATVWLITGHLEALLVWEIISVAYLVGGTVVVWRGSSERNGSVAAARVMARWSWVLPLLSSVVGASAAVVALTARSSPDANSSRQVLLAVAASVGVVVSWTILHVGFAGIYQAMNESDPETSAIEFPGRHAAPFVNYLYFSFTIGTAFATSDAKVTTIPIRRVVVIHSIVSFFYNALVVATAIQVLQQIATR